MSRKNKLKVISETKNRFSQLTDFLTQAARVAGCSNVDHYFRAGSIATPGKIKDLGAYFLRVAMGFEEDEFIPFVGDEEAPNFFPQSEDYYPWAFFCVPTSQEDLMEVFHRKAMQYLHSDAAGKKNYAIITNFRSVVVCDLKHYISDYDLAFADLHDAINHQSDTKEAQKAVQAWSALLELTFRTLFRSSDAILAAPPEKRGERTLHGSLHML